MKALVIVASLLLGRAASASAIDEARLEQAILTLPDMKLGHEDVAKLVAEAIEAAGADLDPLILLAQAYVESRFDSSATSRLVAGKRKVGSWASQQAPSGWSGNLYCGIAQTAASTWAGCLALRETQAALTAQARELRTWVRRTHGDLPRGLAGYGCGNAGAMKGSCHGYPLRILALARHLHKMTAGSC
jgi:hypothetical protein